MPKAGHCQRRAKVKWCKLGDENAKFVHTMATYTVRNNKMEVLGHEETEYYRDTDKINIATLLFKQLFSEGRQWTPILNLQMLHEQ